jgi:hypothetical protein
MKEYLDAFLKFLKSVFSEADGTGSCARILSAVFAVATILWVTYIVRTLHTIPPLGDCTTLIACPYAINKVATKISDAVSALAGKKDGQ